MVLMCAAIGKGENVKRLFIALCAVTALLASAANAGTAPEVTFAKLAPTVVTGSGFAADRPVRVKVTWQGGNLVKVVRVGSSGRFTARWRSSVLVFQCRGLTVAATQAGEKPVTAKPAGAKSCGVIVAPIG
jgi:hypothetical protein